MNLRVILIVALLSVFCESKEWSIVGAGDETSKQEISDSGLVDLGKQVDVERNLGRNQSISNEKVSNSSDTTNSTNQMSCIRGVNSGLPVEVMGMCLLLIECTERFRRAPSVLADSSANEFQIVNSSKLATLLHVEPNITSRHAPGNCAAVLFYSPSCPFSCMAAPHFNALSRFFPDLRLVAVDAVKYRSINAQFGIVGTPTLMLFHNGRPAAKLNETSEYGLDLFANFITRHTGVEPDGKLVVMSTDFGGPVPSIPVKETDYYLLLSWSIIAARLLYSLYYSAWGRNLVDATLNAWREAEAQHQHPHAN